jgi:iron complex transport system permease protein
LLKPPSHWPRLALAALLAALALVWDLRSGPAAITYGEMLDMLLGRIPADSNLGAIFLDFRLPRVLTALCAGAVLPVAGALMQSLFRNPLASPSELGVSAGASLGVALVVLGAETTAIGAWLSEATGFWGLAGAGMAGATLVMLLVLSLSIRMRQTATLLIAGLLLTQWISAGIGLLQWVSGSEKLRVFTFWGLGSLGAVDMPRLQFILPMSALGLLVAFLCAKPLDALALGEEAAAALGVRVHLLRWVLLLIASWMTATITAFCGPIAFVALMVPHFARALMRRTAHAWVLPACILLGAALMLACDALTQWPRQGGVLPINSITALLGAPVILMVLIRRERRS